MIITFHFVITVDDAVARKHHFFFFRTVVVRCKVRVVSNLFSEKIRLG
jgi:hypothetical protein